MIAKIILWVTAALAAISAAGAPRPSDARMPALLFSAAWALGAAHPDGAWRRGLMIGLSVPLAALVAQEAHVVLPYASPGPLLSCLALVPALAGSWAGVVTRRRWNDAAGAGVPPHR